MICGRTQPEYDRYMTSPQEIELKLLLPAVQTDAFRKRMARRRTVKPVEQDLLTIYFDTPDFALAKAGMALRVRRDGRRWLQTLKTEGDRHGGLSRRLEYEMAVGKGVPDWSRFPPEAQALVAEDLRAHIVPVFETRFRRTAWLLEARGGTRIEVALDVGEIAARKGADQAARSESICEIELELKSGRPDALFALGLEWARGFGCVPFDPSKAERGAALARGVAASPVKASALVLDTGMSVEDGFAAIVRVCLAHFQANLPGVLEILPRVRDDEGAGETPANAVPTPADGEIEYVHQARVALRRLRAALRLFRRVCVLPDELMADLRAVTGALGPTRDWDVLTCETLPMMAPHYPDPARWTTGADALQAQRAEVRAAMQTSLATARPGAWLLSMHRWLLRHGWRTSSDGAMVSEMQRFEQLSPLDAWVRVALQRGHRRVMRGARVFDELEPVERHALRIEIKRQRYAVEFFQALFTPYPKTARRQGAYLAILRAGQESLGRANDAHIAWELLTTAPAAPSIDFALGWLAATLANGDDEESAAIMADFLDTRTYW